MAPDRCASALILPLSGAGNAGIAALSMKNAAEMALDEFKNPNIQLLVKDDAGAPQTAQAGAQQALDEGAEMILGPLFAQSVSAVAQVARSRGIPVIAFSTDASVAARGVYLLSFLPESDVRRIVEYAVSRGKRSFAALMPDNAYGTVVEAAFQQDVPRHGGRVLALEKYPLDPNKMADAGQARGAGANRVDCDLHSRQRGRAAHRAIAGGRRRQSQARATARHRSVGRRHAHRYDDRSSTAAGTRRRSRPASAISPAAIAPASARIRCARRRSPMTRWRWSRRW